MAKEIGTESVVCLKSGGKPMTVHKVECPTTDHTDDVAVCYWIDENGEGRTFKFPVSVLRFY
jgi:uncharacterized protein YodC (DUF2158 family)